MLLSKESKEDDPKKQQWAHEGSYNQLYPKKLKMIRSQEIMNRVFNITYSYVVQINLRKNYEYLNMNSHYI